MFQSGPRLATRTTPHALARRAAAAHRLGQHHHRLLSEAEITGG
jgi:hypothetical protein